ncbi:MAG: succinate dehydrogenase assembly factor 2 [Wenzhouxiangella sp.]|jgi:antitoxin CptB|nr:succinate dehydrogenase assembly factor 2 [Wenzhouxiangella sp.]
MRELDTLLTRWLEQRWPSAGQQRRDAFERLLQSEDDQLWDWLLGRSRPDSIDLAEIVDDVRLAAARSD